MNRRSFFGALLAVIAAPAVLIKTKRPLVQWFRLKWTGKDSFDLVEAPRHYGFARRHYAASGITGLYWFQDGQVYFISDEDIHRRFPQSQREYARSLRDDLRADYERESAHWGSYYKTIAGHQS